VRVFGRERLAEASEAFTNYPWRSALRTNTSERSSQAERSRLRFVPGLRCRSPGEDPICRAVLSSEQLALLVFTRGRAWRERAGNRQRADGRLAHAVRAACARRKSLDGLLSVGARLALADPKLQSSTRLQPYQCAPGSAGSNSGEAATHSQHEPVVRRSPIEVLTATVLPFVLDPKCRRVCKMEGKLKQRCTTRTRLGRMLITPIERYARAQNGA
jgi:hypothetical protein